jgi:hypothetical protein
MSNHENFLPRQNESADAYQRLRDDVAGLAAAGSIAADDILSLVFRRLTSERPAYFGQMIDDAAGELVIRKSTDPATLRLLFNSLIGQSPLSGLSRV